MATTSQYLEQLQQDRNNFADALVDKGVSAFKTETFTSLVGKIKNIKPKLQDKTVAPTESGRTVTSDSGYEGLNQVTISPIQPGAIKNLTADNIKRNVEILGLVGTYGSTSQIKYVTPSTSQQTVEPDPGAEFLSKVIVHPVTNYIDSNIVPTNIRKGTSILGVEGIFDGDFVFQTKTASLSTTSDQVIKADEGYDAIEQITIPKVTASIDSRITADNIRRGVTILGVQGTYAPKPSMENKTITPTTYDQVIKPDSGYGYMDQVTVKGVTSSVDLEIKPENIRTGVNILGVEGTLQPLNSENIVIEPSLSVQTFEPSAGKNAFAKVTVNPVTSSVEPNAISSNIKKGISILGIEGAYEGASSLQVKTVTPGVESKDVVADEGYDALSKVVVEAVETEDITVIPSLTSKTYTRSNDKFINSVNVEAVSADVDPNIQPGNIRRNMSILGVVGTYAGEEQSYFQPLTSSGSSSAPGILKALKSIPNDLVITTGYYMFTNCKGLTAVPKLDYSQVTTSYAMFEGCSALVDLSGLSSLTNTTNITSMFKGCTSLTYIDASIFSKSTTWSHVFNGCSGLTTVNLGDAHLPNFSLFHTFQDCSKLTEVIYNGPIIDVGQDSPSYGFAYCSSLVRLDLSWYKATLKQPDYLFQGCKKLQFLDIRNMEMTTITFSNGMFTSIPNDCEIIVKDDSNRAWIKSKFANLTNIKTVAEYEGASA